MHRFYASSRLKAGLLLFNTCSLAVVALLLFGFAIFCLSDSKDAGELVAKTLFFPTPLPPFPPSPPPTSDLPPFLES